MLVQQYNWKPKAIFEKNNILPQKVAKLAKLDRRHIILSTLPQQDPTVLAYQALLTLWHVNAVQQAAKITHQDAKRFINVHAYGFIHLQILDSIVGGGGWGGLTG